MIEAVIFDLDGVLTDTAVYHYQSWKAIAAKFNYDLTEEDNEKLKGVSRADSLTLILKWATARDEKSYLLWDASISNSQISDLLIEKNEHYLKLINELSEKDILPGVMDFLELLSQNNCALAVGSSSKNARFILDKLGLISKFSAIIDGNGVKNTKPDPEVFLNAAAELKVNPKNCLVIEDAPSGIKAAKAAGMKVIGIGKDLLEADYCLPNLEGITWSQIQDI